MNLKMSKEYEKANPLFCHQGNAKQNKMQYCSHPLDLQRSKRVVYLILMWGDSQSHTTVWER